MLHEIALYKFTVDNDMGPAIVDLLWVWQLVTSCFLWFHLPCRLPSQILDSLDLVCLCCFLLCLFDAIDVC